MDSIAIKRAMEFQNMLFNPRSCPPGRYSAQFVFEESDGTIPVRLSIEDRKSTVLDGYADAAFCEIRTNLRAWNDVCGGFLSFPRAILSGKIRLKGDMLRFRRLYSGSKDADLPDGLFSGGFEIGAIKNVVVLNCSPRCEKGATHALAERFIMGMTKAGATVDTLYPARMKIHPCVGCFKCWDGFRADCVFHERDEMQTILDTYRTCDLVVWATPVYHYGGSTAMKTVMDRLFVNADPRIVKVDGQFRHPRKMERLPYYAVLAVGGFPDGSIFEPLRSTFRALANHTGIKLIGEIYRHTSMPFADREVSLKGKTDALNAVEEAGMELITRKRIRQKTKRIAERNIVSLPMMMAVANATNVKA